jgi:SAM-dependent methyltransferase
MRPGAATVADVGSGTGILTGLLLERGCRVLAVEPNREMRAAAERRLGGDERFTSVAGRAEETGLAPASVDLVTAGQAFHWFDAARAREEFRRILRPGGVVALLWNDRKVDATPFLRAYEALLRRFGTDYAEVQHRTAKAQEVEAFFGPGRHAVAVFPGRQDLDLEGLRGRLLSSSYVPEAGHPDHEPMLAALGEIFAAHERDGTVALEYDTVVYHGRLG